MVTGGSPPIALAPNLMFPRRMLFSTSAHEEREELGLGEYGNFSAQLVQVPKLFNSETVLRGECSGILGDTTSSIVQRSP